MYTWATVVLSAVHSSLVILLLVLPCLFLLQFSVGNLCLVFFNFVFGPCLFM